MPIDPRIARLRAELANAERWQNGRAPEIRAEMALVNAEIALTNLVKLSPSLSDGKRDRLAAILGR